jgi:hypothetical protein
MTTFVPATLQVIRKFGDLGGFPLRCLSLGELSGSQPSSDRLATDAKLIADSALRITLVVQFYDCLIPIKPPLPTLLSYL